ncbi:MAG: Phenylalanine-tRNA ligase beta subunit [candidate division TM6 bacterium GW2011_GWF2_28_16]|nr:MAG: Phenylalanine-tRNA ligase beta subunit [candidate division TM6 bacterium GW2011_GWF2_28_16]
MKLSIAWIFDHINADWRKQDIDYLISKFNAVSGEIEDFYKVKFDLDKFAIGKVIEIKAGKIKFFVPEWGTEYNLPERVDADINAYFMVTKNSSQVRFTTLNDFDLSKDGLIPELYVHEKDVAGDWKKNFETEDYIIEVDNKSITNRPDMWGHRGFAREIAAFMDLELLPESKFLDTKEIFDYDKLAKTTDTNKIAIEVEDTKACLRFSGIYFDSIKNRGTDIFILSRFLKVDMRPINMLVDLTNYLMLDWSQPVHAYDAKSIENNKIIARMAKKNEKIKLLDGNDLELSNQDLVIADNKKILGLAGIMGGAYSGISKNTKEIFLESANFEPEVMRKTALKYNVRTDACARFEKTLDKNQTSQAILRFLNLLKLYKVEFNAAQEIISVGAQAKNLNIKISHDFLEKRLGIELQDYEVTLPLTRLGFNVQIEKQENSNVLLDDAAISKKNNKIYSITVPTFRSSKDISIKEDILEEVIRFYGFDKIALEMPKIEKRPYKLNNIFRLRKFKNYLVEAAKMTEQQNYVFFYEPFLQSINCKIENVAAKLLNPVSDDQYRLVNSLLPNLFKNIKDNFAHQDSLRFFEFGRIWKVGVRDEIVEKRYLSGIFFEKKIPVDFYFCKSYITGLLELINLNFKELKLESVKEPESIWAMPYMTANIYFETKKIGKIGKVDPVFLAKLDVLPESDAFFFELDADFLFNHESKIKKFTEISKYQDSFVDLSLVVPINIKTIDIEDILKKVSNLVYDVNLIDSFERQDWADKKALTFRLSLKDLEHTIEKTQIDKVWQDAIKILEKHDIKLRA